uniref:Beaded filament structural protein 2, phakinin n=1 Tax=Cyprinodon variegatus TaxID=28743 RepID=A0A3Q2CJ88_CYPVA
MEGGRREDGDRTEGGRREDGGRTEGGRTEGGWREDGGRTEGGRTEQGRIEDGGRAEGGQREDGERKEGGQREDGRRTEGGWREDGGRTEGGWRQDRGRTEGGQREGGQREDGERTEGGRREDRGRTWLLGLEVRGTEGLISYFLQVSEAILDNARLMLQTENIQANAEDFKERYENEQPFRRAVEDEISSLHRVIEEATMTKVDLEEQMENMRAELRSLEDNYEQDVRGLYNQMAGREVDEPDAPIETSLDQILAHIRSHWERMMEKNRAETDGCLECKEAQSVGSRLSPEEEQVEALKTECSEVGCKIQSLQAETESIRALKRGLENSLADARHWHDVELQNLGSVVAKLEAEFNDVRGEIEQQRRDYDVLLMNRQRLEQEIGLYHGILDGEESRYLPTDTGRQWGVFSGALWGPC